MGLGLHDDRYEVINDLRLQVTGLGHVIATNEVDLDAARMAQTELLKRIADLEEKITPRRRHLWALPVVTLALPIRQVRMSPARVGAVLAAGVTAAAVAVAVPYFQEPAPERKGPEVIRLRPPGWAPIPLPPDPENEKPRSPEGGDGGNAEPDPAPVDQPAGGPDSDSPAQSDDPDMSEDSGGAGPGRMQPEEHDDLISARVCLRSLVDRCVGLSISIPRSS